MSDPTGGDIRFGIRVTEEGGAKVVQKINEQLEMFRNSMSDAARASEGMNKMLSGEVDMVGRLNTRLNTLVQITDGWGSSTVIAQDIARGIMKAIREEGLAAVATARQIEQLAQAHAVISGNPIPELFAPQAIAGTRNITAAVVDLDKQINVAVGRFREMGKLVDLTNADAVAGFRAQGAAVKAELIDLGAQNNQLRELDAAIRRVERAHGAAGVPQPVTTPSQAAIPTAGIKFATAAVADLNEQVNFAVGRFQEMGKLVDTSSATAVKGFRAQGEAIKAELVELGAQNNQLRELDIAMRRVERAGGAAGVPKVAPATPAPVPTANVKFATAAVADLSEQVNIAIGQFQEMGKLVDTSSRTAVAGFRAQGEAVKDELIQLGAQNVQLREIEASVRRVERAYGQGRVAQSTPQAVPTANVKYATAAVSDLDSRINIAMGSLARMGELVDLSSAKAVKAFRAQGQAVKDELVALGAQETELGRLSSIIGKVEQQYGALQASQAAGVKQQDRTAVSARRGANALATLSFGLMAGGVSARTMAIGVGSAVSALAEFSDNAAIAASASGIGALITVLAVVIGLFYDLNHEEEKTQDTLGNIGNLRASQLKILQKQTESQIAGFQRLSAAQADQVAKDAQSLNPLANIRAAFHTFEARKTQEHYQNLLKMREDLTKQLVEAETKEAKEVNDRARQESDRAEELAVDRLRGPAAARRKAAQDELNEQIYQMQFLKGTAQDTNRLLEAYQEQHKEKIIAIDREEAQQRRELFEKLQNDRLNAEAKLSEDTFQVQREAASRHAEQEADKIKRDRNLLSDATGLERRTALALNAQALTADLQAIEKQRTEAIEEIIQEAKSKLSTLSEQGLDAEKIRGDYRKSLQVLQAAIDSTSTSPAQKAAAKRGQELIAALIPQEVAKSRLDQLYKQLGSREQAAQENVTRAEALAAAHLLTERQSRQQILAATIAQRDAIATSLPALVQQAALLPGNAEEQEKIEQYRTKLLQLNITIMQLSDDFYQLKQAGIEAAQNALENFIKSGPGLLFGQGKVIADLDVVRNHLRVANDQLNALLNNPSQTSETQQRISQLRTEIQDTTMQLTDQQDALVTWRSVFLDALRSITTALFDVASHMLAVYAIQQLLKGMNFGGGGGGAAAGVLQVAGDIGGVNAATGGYIRGPGTGTSDSVPAWLSNGEYVLRASAVRSLGTEFLDLLNELGPKAIRGRGYAAGGLVAERAAPTAGSFGATIDLADGLVVRHLKSRAGQDAVVNAVVRNRKTITALLSGRS